MADKEELTRQHAIYKVTIGGSAVNVFLLIFKFIAGILGGSSAMIADAVHSLSDFLTDIAVLVFVRLSNKPQDKDHDFGHGKYETLATALIGIALLLVGTMICVSGLEKIRLVIHGTVLPSPGIIAFVAAIVSILLKEWCFQFTMKVGRHYNSQAVVANAWHHRSDALSSIGTAVGIGGAIILGEKWTVLDPLTAIAVSVFIIWEAVKLIRQSSSELLEASLPDDIEQQIVNTALREKGVSEVHNLRTRRIGDHYAIEMHIRMPGEMNLYEAHKHATRIEDAIRQLFGSATHIIIHLEPLKVDGRYVDPDEAQ
ncbi:cation efflux system protein [Hallella multisaccharivorax DSM 17128]|uniref:Cation diffusion facilitator family transporter n=1 Tax=Hallella multisaccharivorax DSM 17128 TaxID=688246 RepID=F8NCP0_9BACT|nr:cation diffusion facilitator family transporter [Hallella multisaccharivorax]EGN57076.1 cation diffusion facilitator family transporter [Hallella multisaccharivorax DSM 17128]GJG30616.1 cation efflux system protein [Hallella multisaccharivorax DSM 17128]